MYTFYKYTQNYKNSLVLCIFSTNVPSISEASPNMLNPQKKVFAKFSQHLKYKLITNEDEEVIHYILSKVRVAQE